MSEIPFLKTRKLASVLISKHKEDGSVSPAKEDQTPEGLVHAMSELMRAHSNNDAAAMARAFQAAFEMCESAEPYRSDESSHLPEGEF